MDEGGYIIMPKDPSAIVNCKIPPLFNSFLSSR